MKSKPFILGKMLIFHKKIRIFLQSSSQSSLYENNAIVFRENDIVSMNSRIWAFRTPEPKAHRCQWSGVRPRRLPSSSVHNFKRLLLRSHLANQSQILCGASLGRKNESMYKWFRSHDQDGRDAHIW